LTVRPPTPRRLLIVAYYYPPQNIIGARRPSALAKWLRRRGHEITVLTSVQSGHDPNAAPSRVVRSRDLLATRLNWRGQSLDVVTGQSDAAWDPDPGIWGKLFVPDVQLLSWAPFAVATALRLHRRIGFDAVVTSSPVESVHAVGLALSARGVPWVADLRDGWCFEAPRGRPQLMLQRRLDDVFERIAVRRADALVMVTEPLSADLRSRHDVQVETITNGFDPDDEELLADTGAPVDAAKLTLVHTGGLGSRQTVRPLLDALVRIAADDSTLGDRVELVLAGQQTTEQRDLYARSEYVPFIRHLGFVDRSTSLVLQRAADVLVLVTSGDRRGEATGKLFEYLAAGHPILALAAGSAAADIVSKAGAGIVIPTRDTAAAESALRRILAEGLPSPPASGRADFAYPALAERYEVVIERAIAQRVRGGETRSAESDPATAT